MGLTIVKYFIYLSVFFKCQFQATVHINVTIASTKGGAGVTFGGADVKLISDLETALYNITEYNLKKGIRVELGKEPNDIFLKDPTTYGNLYHKYKWKEIDRIVKVKSAKIDDIINEGVVLKVHNHINNTTRKKKIKINLHESVETMVHSFWDKDGFRDAIFYNLNVNYHKTKLSFKNKWMDYNFKSLTSVFGMYNTGFINIAPGGTVTAKLTAKRTILLVKVVYVASLAGNLVANYARLYGKYHFWAPTISNIMKAAKLNNELITTETIEIKCYTDPVISVFDKTTGKNIPMQFINKPFRKRKLKKS